MKKTAIVIFLSSLPLIPLVSVTAFPEKEMGTTKLWCVNGYVFATGFTIIVAAVVVVGIIFATRVSFFLLTTFSFVAFRGP